MIARHPQVTAALIELRALIVDGDDHDTGWMLALGFHRGLDDTYERAALRSLAVALAAGDEARAVRAARWITNPTASMDEALASVTAERVLDREVQA